MSWTLPNALHNHHVMSTAWYAPTGLSPFPPSRPELEDEEDEEGITSSMQYLVSLVDDLVSQGVPEKRIVLGGFSQGHAMALFTGLTSSKYSGRLGGLVGLSGYLPLIERIPKLREAAGLPEKVDDDVQVFITRGTRDMLVPKRYLTLCSNSLLDCGVKQEHLTVREYEGMGHIMGGAELRDLCTWLERVVPPLQ
ncbi:alpha/beta-hydrolase [Karstenula rhodostoma CBS 690.94]|uniref:Acyl-protein thioesterase 1 n=1 Tax=Karstenula rhodostoma CBS 690.94 TaxID=1392251 RepID=A0A9P4PFH3_9PLEO|nr:alpha/beta-hydrolase [Karstenula rhodostoma CBS 690.94]